MSNCEEIVTWLKNFFTAKDDECNYKVTASNYTPNIDGSVTITVTVTDGNGDAVSGHSFKLDADGTEVTLTTNSSGVATHSYSCSTWGLHTFSVGEASVQINVRGWKLVHTALNDGTNTIKVYSNGELAEYSIQLGDYTVSAQSSNKITGFDTTYAPIEMIWITSAVYGLYSTISDTEMRINNATSSSHNMLKASFIAQLKTPLY